MKNGIRDWVLGFGEGRGMRGVLSSLIPKTHPLIPLLFLLTACGFQPLHGRDYRDNQNINLAAIIISVDTTRNGQMLEAEIKDAINPDYAQHDKLYTLSIKITQTEQHLFINPDGTSGRSDIPTASSYKLTRISDGKQVDSGSITRISSYNVSGTADYSSYIAMEDAKKRSIREIAQNYKLHLANILARLQDPDFHPPATEPTSAPKPQPIF